MTTEREITEPVALADGSRLNPAAVGWSRRPIQSTAISGWGRTKRWEYWGVVTDTHLVGIVLAGIDYLATASIYVLDRATGEETTRDGITPFGRPQVSDDPGVSTARLAAGLGPTRVLVDITDKAGATTIHATAKGVDVALDVQRPDHDSLGVVVPWSDTRFQYTLKDLANPVTGTVTIDGTSHDIGAGWAVLDRGRGRWPWSMAWNWGAGSGVVGGSTRAIQVGGQWTEGTGSTENGLLVDGRLHKISDELTWTYDARNWLVPWRVTGERLEVTFTPFHLRRAVTDLGVLAVRTHQCFGTWSGTGVLDDGSEVSLDGLVGWAEEAHNRW